MPFWTLNNVAAALERGCEWDGVLPALPRGDAAVAGFSTDTRTLRRGEAFVALRGERFDGHDFLETAVQRGAAALVVSDATRAARCGVPVYEVSDTLSALGALASFWRRNWGGVVVAVAGSNGKTTTKELLRAALSASFCVHATEKNFNNRVGVPLTLLGLPQWADVAVVEVGTSEPGEIELLRRIVRPDISIVTSIAEEHLAGLGDLAGVLREETAIFRDAELAIVPAAQPDVVSRARALARQVVVAGLDGGDLVPDEWGLEADGRGWLRFGGQRTVLRLRGAHNLRNALLALAAARACGTDVANALERLAAVEPVSMRGEVKDIGTLTVIDDSYNANPGSMREAIALLDAMTTERPKVIVLGTMLELGPRSTELHFEIARRALQSQAVLVAGLGEFALALEHLARGDPRVLAAASFEELSAALEARVPRDAVVLIKGSRGMRLERLVSSLERIAGDTGSGAAVRT
jgi:UDP-N-acetylmuramoyl-tripeptide--D-alanyl-D-alanine ligase